ncbi:MAG: hypothetical protein M3299_04310 [Thermoproteota archaeon]|nr:hypothetical protein [Thermoproteota archaeon]
MNLSDNYQIQAQFNTVVVQQKEMDRVGLFEPTTCGSEEPDSTITTPFHDWLPSLRREKRLSG